MAFRKLLLVSLAMLCMTCRAETFLITSDLHLTRDASAHASTLAALRAAAENTDTLILLGDSTNNAHDEEHALALDFLASLNKPAYVVPGNHDVTLNISDFIGKYSAYGWNQAFSRDTDSGSCAVMTAGGTCLILLETNDMPGHVAPLGGISAQTSAWVSRTVAALPEGTPVIACGHHPILPEERWERTPGAQALTQALSGVRLYLCGHDHGFAAVASDGLQQITVGQPHAYPGWAGLLSVTGEGIHWQVLQLYDEVTRQTMKANALALAEGMARGTLAGTVHENDAEAIHWFAEAFEMWLTSRLNADECARLLSQTGAQKWREIETRTVVKRWIFGLLEECPQDVREIDISF